MSSFPDARGGATGRPGGGPHQGALARHHRVLDHASSAGYRFAPGAAEDGRAEAAQWLRREAPHWLAALRAVAAAGDHRRVMEAAGAVYWFSGHWAGDGPWEEVFARGRDAARALGETGAEAAFLNHASWHYSCVLGRRQKARACAVAARSCARRAGDPVQAAWALLHSALAVSPVDGELAAEEAARAAAEFELLHHAEGTLRAVATAARTLSGAGRHEEARPYLERLATLFEEPVDERLRPLAAPTLAWACLLNGEGMAAAGRWEDAERVYRRGLADLDLAEAPGAEVTLCLGLAGVLRRRLGPTAQGAALLRRALHVAMAADDVQGAQRVLRALDDWVAAAR
ncbi:hypothetical protein [Streptomyces sp. CB03238]|uniref:hypothetical protein n=1 Tax=Streptomyces sp. CB03238 TaxID=1907777 RepID=UPI000A11AEAA|nr:hypothetical protein [Streptomyces sp. CB03238]ORT57383.1 hypothetical protein BKD26_24290 [Streptomyces sp. CB03238]